MDWIKKNYDQFALALLALLLIAVSVLLMLKAKGFDEQFDSVRAQAIPNNKIEPLDKKPIEEAQTRFGAPATWTPEPTKAFLFVPKRYVIANGKPEELTKGSVIDSLTKQLISNEIIIKDGFNPLNATVTMDDPDKDGFVNEDEWRVGQGDWFYLTARTDPNDAKSHPPYHTKLFLVKWIKVPFRLKFQSYSDDPKKVPKEKMDYAINTVDVRQPTQFKRIGEVIDRTKFKVIDFQFKEVANPKTGEMDDVSELTLQHTETGEKVVLVLNQIIDSPDSYGLFDYEWNGTPIQVKKLQEFVLKPDTDQKYKLIDIKEGEAQIQLPSGEMVTIKPDPRKK